MHTPDLFEQPAAAPQVIQFVPKARPAAAEFPAGDIEAMVERAEGTLTRLMQQGHPIVVSWSAGKDSSCVLNLLLSAGAKLAATGAALPPIVVLHGDVLVENPEMTVYARSEMAQVRAFAREHHIPLTLEVATPSLSQQWAVRVISGRAMPSFPGVRRDCSMELKLWPMQRKRKEVLQRLDALAGPAAVVLVGTRYEESTVRAANMAKRGESDTELRTGDDGNLYLSPVAHWSTDDVWTYLSLARNKAVLAYSTFDDTFRVYADSMNTSCVIVAEDIAKAIKASKACGARTGCWACVATGERDKSMENMLEQDRYAYMRGLNRLRNFLANTRWDFSRRNWLGRTIKHDYIRIYPDGYNPGMLEELLRYALTLDIEERAAAARLGIAPRFQIVSLQALFAIDAMWSLQAFHRPYHALAIWDEIENHGQRYPVPEVPEFPKPKMPKPLYLHVGPDWDEDRWWDMTGLRNVALEAVRHDGDGCMGTRTLGNGTTVLDVRTDDAFAVDEEGAILFLDFEFERAMAAHDAKAFDPTAAYHHYVNLGLLAIHDGGVGTVDYMLRRSAFKTRHGYAGQIDHTRLLDRAVTAKEAGISEKAHCTHPLPKKPKRGKATITAPSPAAENESELLEEAA